MFYRTQITFLHFEEEKAKKGMKRKAVWEALPSTSKRCHSLRYCTLFDFIKFSPNRKSYHSSTTIATQLQREPSIHSDYPINSFKPTPRTPRGDSFILFYLFVLSCFCSCFVCFFVFVFPNVCRLFYLFVFQVSGAMFSTKKSSSRRWALNWG